MAKYCGTVGFCVPVETEPGVWEDTIDEHKYTGDLYTNTRRIQNSGNLNSDISLSNEISIIADPFAHNNFHSIRYATFMGAKWEVTNVRVQFPRLILTIGGVYNGPENRAPEDIGGYTGKS